MKSNGRDDREERQKGAECCETGTEYGREPENLRREDFKSSGNDSVCLKEMIKKQILTAKCFNLDQDGVKLMQSYTVSLKKRTFSYF